MRKNQLMLRVLLLLSILLLVFLCRCFRVGGRPLANGSSSPGKPKLLAAAVLAISIPIAGPAQLATKTLAVKTDR